MVDQTPAGTRLARAAATLGGLGRIGPAPGTLASALAALSGGLVWTLWGAGALWGMAVLSCGLALVAIARALPARGETDPPEIVIDEWAGQLLALAVTALLLPEPDGRACLAAFALFRLFDILKPGPVRWAEGLRPAELGILADDLLAGVAAGGLAGLIGRMLTNGG
ncbi:MAG: phosphatidylglycerophosphatase A [Alphaproteobacteria bacterium]|nr:phosphatidylglycerophosphatase A [Alphaproteobacteria bacterium]